MAAAARAHAAVAVYALLRRDEQVLLLRRAGSGVHDGELCLPAGHVEAGEDALSAVVREVGEELLLRVRAEDCTLVLTGHSGPERAGDDAYVDLFFVVEHWSGEPAVGESERNQGLVWAPVHDLPPDVVPFVADAVRVISSVDGPRLLLWHWPHRPGGRTR